MFDVEILAIARRLGYRIQQVPVRWRDDADSRLEHLRKRQTCATFATFSGSGWKHRFGGRLK